MQTKPFGPKAVASIQNTDYLTVWEGAVRSAKTTVSLLAWLRYVINSPEHIFLMSGNTLGSISRNCIDGDYGLIALTADMAQKRTDTDGSKFIELAGNRIYYVGADNRRSYTRIRGMTIGGWYGDEINLQAREFVEEAFRRSFASSDRRNMWTLNPDVPSHWIYTDFIDRYDLEKMPGFRHNHFTLDDNPAISEIRKEEIKRQYTGVFYKRYVLGLRVRAEGGCYPSFSDKNILHEVPSNVMFVEIGVDIGGTGSATTFSAVGYFKPNDRPMGIVILDEHYDKKNDSTERVLDNFRDFVGKIKERWRCGKAYVDSAEQLILRSMRNLAVVDVGNSQKKPINDRIRFTDLMLARGRFYVMDHCTHTLEAIQSAVWDEKSKNEQRLDDGTVNVDSLDAMEYAFERRMKELI